MPLIKNITKDAVVNDYLIQCECIFIKIKFDCKLGYYNMLLDKTNSQKKFYDLRFPKLYKIKNKIFLVLKKMYAI